MRVCVCVCLSECLCGLHVGKSTCVSEVCGCVCVCIARLCIRRPGLPERGVQPQALRICGAGELIILTPHPSLSLSLSLSFSLFLSLYHSFLILTPYPSLSLSLSLSFSLFLSLPPS